MTMAFFPLVHSTWVINNYSFKISECERYYSNSYKIKKNWRRITASFFHLPNRRGYNEYNWLPPWRQSCEAPWGKPWGRSSPPDPVEPETPASLSHPGAHCSPWQSLLFQEPYFWNIIHKIYSSSILYKKQCKAFLNFSYLGRFHNIIHNIKTFLIQNK